MPFSPASRLQTPRENRSFVVVPSWNEIPRAVQTNIEARSAWNYDFQGKSSRILIDEARRELFQAAKEWTGRYRNVSDTSFSPEMPFFLAGHQPQLFHPGVWLKNFALGRLAKKHRATAVNLIIDSDVTTGSTLPVPGGSVDAPDRIPVAYDLPAPMLPYEERRIEDRALFESFADRALAEIAQLGIEPLLRHYWPMAVNRSREVSLLGASLAQSRHLLEESWDVRTWEVPQSIVCDQPAFFWFAASLLAQLPRFLSLYNESVHAYRRAHRIRNHAHPVPDLSVEGEWLETPFWIWTETDPQRRRLFARTAGRETILSDRFHAEIRLPLSPDTDPRHTVEVLLSLRGRGVKIRSRAILTTLWARLVLSDFFLHGIGGGHYDRVTDLILHRFFDRRPPSFGILSATLHLPISRGSDNVSKNPTDFDRLLRELAYHPERNLKFDSHVSEHAATLDELIVEKRRWIETTPTRENAKIRCRSIRRVNEQLQPWLARQRDDLLEERSRAVREREKEKIFGSREYAFCLFPESTLREFFEAILKQIDCV